MTILLDSPEVRPNTNEARVTEIAFRKDDRIVRIQVAKGRTISGTFQKFSTENVIINDSTSPNIDQVIALIPEMITFWAKVENKLAATKYPGTVT